MKKEDKHTIQRELKAMGSKMPEAEGNQAFHIPHGYFEGLPQNIQQCIIDQRKRPSYWFSVLDYKSVVPIFSAAVLVIAITIGLFNYPGVENGKKMFAGDEVPDMEYFAVNFSHDQEFLYHAVSESDLSIDDILYGLDNGLDAVNDDSYDELMEQLFEEAQYFGMDSNLLLSYLD